MVAAVLQPPDLVDDGLFLQPGYSDARRRPEHAVRIRQESEFDPPPLDDQGLRRTVAPCAADVGDTVALKYVEGLFKPLPPHIERMVVREAQYIEPGLFEVSGRLRRGCVDPALPARIAALGEDRLQVPKEQVLLLELMVYQVKRSFPVPGPEQHIPDSPQPHRRHTSLPEKEEPHLKPAFIAVLSGQGRRVRIPRNTPLPLEASSSRQALQRYIPLPRLPPRIGRSRRFRQSCEPPGSRWSTERFQHCNTRGAEALTGHTPTM